MITLDELPRGIRARVESLTATGRAGQRLFEMGLIPGSNLTMIGAAPMGDPLEIELEDYRLSLRRAEARQVQVSVLDESSP